MADFDLASARPVFDVKGALSQTDKALGLPDGFSAAQINVESGFNPSAVSPRGAMGLAQVMPDTLKTVSQRLGRDLDPMNPADAVLIHREVMRENLAKFGSPDKALMAYNGGWDPSKWGNPQTRAYVGKVSAAFKGENPALAAAGRAVGAVVPSAQAAAPGFDLSTAKPVPFDLSTARPVAAGPTAAARIEADPITQGARNFANDIGPVQRFVAGYGRWGADLARGIGQDLGLVDRADVAERRRLDAPLEATTAGKVGNVLGGLVPMAATALIPGANTLLIGSGIGALTGALQPSTSTGETLANIGFGAAGGAAVPVASWALRTGRAAAEPFYEAGRNAIVGRALNRAAGQDAPVVAQRLQEAATPFVGPSNTPIPRTTMGELVPGSLPTVGQAAGNPGVAALERAATAGNPEVTNAVSNLMTRQNAARVGVLDEMAGRTSGARDFFGAARDATADQLYANARANGLAPLSAQQQALVGDLMQRPAVRDALAQARRLAANEGLDLADPAGSVAGLDYVRRALADQVQNATGNERRILTALQDRLTGVMDRISPDLRAARETYAGMSRPLNQMDVAHELAQRSVNPLSGNLQPAAYARSLNDATAARATGFPGATLENTMSNAQRNQLNSMLADVQRSNAAQTVGRGVGSDTVQKLAYTNILDQSGVPTLLRNFAPGQVVGNLVGRTADAAYARANRELAGRLAEVMLDPGQAAQLMTQATPRELNQLLRLAQRGTSGLAIAAPSTANRLQQ